MVSVERSKRNEGMSDERIGRRKRVIERVLPIEML